MDRPDVTDALLRINEALKHPNNNNAVAIARHDLEGLVLYVTALDTTMDSLHGIIADFNKVIQDTHVPPLPLPWVKFREEMASCDAR